MTNVSTRPLVLSLSAWLAAACGASPGEGEPSGSPAGMPSNNGGSAGGPGSTPSATGAPGGSALGGTAAGGGETQPSPSGGPLAPDAVAGGATAGAGSAAALEGDIRFSVPSGTFEGSLSVSLETPIEGASIHFTLDGSEPTLASPSYDGQPLSIGETRQVRAQAFVGDMPAGRPGTALYVARRFDAVSDLPLIVLEGYGAGKPVDREVYVDMALLVYEPVDGVASLSSAPSLATRGGYHLRGQSSAMFEQAPYRIELWDNASEDADLPLLGMPADSDWALIGPYSDRSLVRNAFAYDLGRDMGLAAPRYAFAEVYINQEARPLDAGDYQGIYMLVETIKNNKDRLDLAQLEPDDVGAEAITGGYIFKFEWAASEEPTLECSGSMPLGGGGFGFPGGGPGGPGGGGGTCWTDLEVVDPEPLAPEQAEFLTDYVQRFHDSLHNEPFAAYSQYIDVSSFVDLFIISELTRNLDAYTRSAYYYKERGGPITAGPLWDYNLTLGMGFGSNLDVVGWQFEEREVASDWFRLLGTDPEFLARVSARWRELRTTLLSEAELEARLDALAAPLAGAAVRDFERWPVAEVGEGLFQIPNEPTWEGQLQAIREWTRERLDWLDSQLSAN